MYILTLKKLQAFKRHMEVYMEQWEEGVVSVLEGDLEIIWPQLSFRRWPAQGHNNLIAELGADVHFLNHKLTPCLCCCCTGTGVLVCEVLDCVICSLWAALRRGPLSGTSHLDELYLSSIVSSLSLSFLKLPSLLVASKSKCCPESSSFVHVACSQLSHV